MPVDRSAWPVYVKQVGVAEIGHLGVDHRNKLYWDGVPIVTSPLAGLTTVEKIAAFVVAACAVLGGIGGFVQGWAAYQTWACTVHWPAICP